MDAVDGHRHPRHSAERSFPDLVKRDHCWQLGSPLERPHAPRLPGRLWRCGQDSRVQPDQLVVQEEPPYWMVVQRQADGSSLPRLAVDEHSARRFRLSQQALAEQYRGQ
jgi:hypothetical protein